MGLEDKADAAGDKLKGKVEEAVGKATDDDSKVLKGKAEQAKGALKDTVADIKAHAKDTGAGEGRTQQDDGRPGEEAAPGSATVG